MGFDSLSTTLNQTLNTFHMMLEKLEVIISGNVRQPYNNLVSVIFRQVSFSFPLSKTNGGKKQQG